MRKYFIDFRKQALLLCLLERISNHGYRDIGNPLIVDENSVAGALDPHYFLDPVSNKHYLIWKEDDPLVPSLIKIRELRTDGLAFRRGSSSETILRSTLSGERFVTCTHVHF